MKSTLIIIMILASAAAGLYGYPKYLAYQQIAFGESEIVKAELERRITQLKSETEIARAEGIAKANEALMRQLGGPENYLRWDYIQMLRETANSPSKTIIYAPPTGTLPITEAGRAH